MKTLDSGTVLAQWALRFPAFGQEPCDPSSELAGVGLVEGNLQVATIRDESLSPYFIHFSPSLATIHRD